MRGVVGKQFGKRRANGARCLCRANLMSELLDLPRDPRQGVRSVGSGVRPWSAALRRCLAYTANGRLCTKATEGVP